MKIQKYKDIWNCAGSDKKLLFKKMLCALLSRAFKNRQQ